MDSRLAASRSRFDINIETDSNLAGVPIEKYTPLSLFDQSLDVLDADFRPVFKFVNIFLEFAHVEESRFIN
jgi:hypothetical protein